MKIITVNLPVQYLKMIEGLIGENGLYPSRSELIRVAVRDFLIRELESAERFTDMSDNPFIDKTVTKNEIKENDDIFVRIPTSDSKNINNMEYKTYRIIKK